MRKLSFSKLLPKGSVLVFSLLILSIMLVTSLTILSSALLNQKAALSTGSSGRSFQVADSGVERVLYQIYKQSNATLEDLGDAIAGGSTATVRCNNGVVSFPVSGGDVKVGFYQDDPSNPGNIISYANCAGTDWRDKVVKIKSEGTAGTTTRAVEVAVAAPIQSWQNMTASRSLGTTYQNTTGNPITVFATVKGGAGSTYRMDIYMEISADNSNWLRFENYMVAADVTNVAKANIQAVVPVGNYYRVNNHIGQLNASLGDWFELR